MNQGKRSRNLMLVAVSALVLQAVLVTSAETLPDTFARGLTVDELQFVYSDKLPVEFEERLQYAFPDGTLRVMVAVEEQSDALDGFVDENTLEHFWYFQSDGFLALATPAQVVDLLADERITFVEPDYPITYNLAVSVADANGRSYSNDGSGVWAYDESSESLVSDVSGVTTPITGDDVTIAIIDSGIDQTHMDFGGWDCTQSLPYQPCDSRILAAYKVGHLFGGLFLDGEFQPTTEYASGHGSHVAGIAAGNARSAREGFAEDGRSSLFGGDLHNFGVAPEADILSLSNGDTLWAGLSTSALAWLVDNGKHFDVRVASNSWGCLGGCSFNPSSTIAGILEDLYDEGIVVTFAVGNDGGGPSGSAFSGYAQSPYVIGVAAYNADNAEVAGFSSRGSSSSNLDSDPANWTPGSESASGERRPDVAAPGVDIWSAASLTGGAASIFPRISAGDAGQGWKGTNPYQVMSGTSMATPHVSGAAALLFDACPNAAPLDVMRAIFVGADGDKLYRAGGVVQAEDWEVGYGAMDIRASVDWLRAQTVC